MCSVCMLAGAHTNMSIYACEGLEINSHCLSQSLSTSFSTHTHTHLFFYVCVFAWLCDRVHVWRSENSLGARSSPCLSQGLSYYLLLLVHKALTGLLEIWTHVIRLDWQMPLPPWTIFPEPHLSFGDRVPHWDQRSVLARLAGQWAPGPLSALLTLLFHTEPPCPDFTWVLRTWTQVLTLTQHTLTTEPLLQPHQ